MEEELELIFEDEASVYLPQVVANENKRKANEEERKANEEERKANEEERKANEEERKQNELNRQEEMENLKDEANELMQELQTNSISYQTVSTAFYTTTTENEKSFDLPAGYKKTSIIEVYVNGFRVPNSKYRVVVEVKSQGIGQPVLIIGKSITLTDPLDVIGTEVEVVLKNMTTAQTKDYDTLKGEKGVDGYTPVRGTDYWTDEDITAIQTYCNNYIDSQFSTILDNINGEVI